MLEAELTTLSKPATNATCKEANIRSGFLQALLSSTLEIYWGGGGYLEYEPGAPSAAAGGGGGCQNSHTAEILGGY